MVAGASRRPARGSREAARIGASPGARRSRTTPRTGRDEIDPGDGRRLPYRDHSFDVVSLFTVLSSLPGGTDAELALQDAWRVLAPDGVLLVWEPRLPNPLNQHTTLIGRDLLRRGTADATIDFPHHHGAAGARAPTRAPDRGLVLRVWHGSRRSGLTGSRVCTGRQVNAARKRRAANRRARPNERNHRLVRRWWKVVGVEASAKPPCAAAATCAYRCRRGCSCHA